MKNVRLGIGLLFALSALPLAASSADARLLYFTVNTGSPPTLLFSIDAATQQIERLGPIPDTLLPGLAPSADTNVLYAADRNNQELLKINVARFPADGSVTTVGSFGRDIRELAYDALTDTLYGFDFGSEELYIIDSATGAAAPTPIGNVGLRLRGLTFDPTTRTLYGMSAFTDDGELLVIDQDTAAPSVVAFFEPGLNQISGIHSQYGSPMFGIGRDSAPNFYTIDEGTGVATAVTPMVLAGQRRARDLAAPLLPGRMAPAAGRLGLFGVALVLLCWASHRLRRNVGS